eukprot:1879430-Heterocapsa_arctica.AAC.1
MPARDSGHALDRIHKLAVICTSLQGVVNSTPWAAASAPALAASCSSASPWTASTPWAAASAPAWAASCSRVSAAAAWTSSARPARACTVSWP